MNKHCYRIIFNRARGLLMVVAEVARSQGAAPGMNTGRRRASPGPVAAEKPRACLPLALAMALGSVGLPLHVSARVVADATAPGSQRPTVLSASNGVTLVNIQTPSAAGVSRNAYSRFDIDQRGVILDNSRGDVQSQLGGWISGNPWLASGSARVILNEVNSSDPSLLHGPVEIAGQRAELVIANPAGLSCDGCGFINASRATLTTGAPVLRGGQLEGYRVQGGAISIVGAGLDSSASDYTDLIARAVNINASVWANQLTVTSGANQVASASGRATAMAAAVGSVPSVGIDVAQLGGMYAGKITLVGTESGVGVRNAGQIGASAGEVSISAEGLLENSGHITAAQGARIDSSTGIRNSGTIYSDGDASLATRGNIQNDHIIAARGDTRLSATGGDSQIVSGEHAVLGAGVQSDGSLSQAGTLSAQATHAISAQGQNLSGADQDYRAQHISLSNSQTEARQLSLEATQGDLDLSDASLTIGQTLSAISSDRLITRAARIRTGDVQVRAQDLIHDQGASLQASGSIDIALQASFTNQSELWAADTLHLSAGSIDNQGDGTLGASRIWLSATDSHTLTNRGLIDGHDTRIDAIALDNLGTGRIYGDHLAIAGETLRNQAEASESPVIAARDRLDIAAETINNSEHALIFSAGDLAIGGSLDADLHAMGQAQQLLNSSATIEALGALRIDARDIQNLNAHFSATSEALPSQHIQEYQGSGSSRRYVPTPGVAYAYDDESLHLHTPEGNYENWNEYNYTRRVVETRVSQSDPAKILAGADIQLGAESLLNDKSHIIAGGAINADLATVTNTEVAGTRTTTESGNVTHYWRDHEKGRDDTGSQVASYRPASVVELIPLTPTLYQQNTAHAIQQQVVAFSSREQGEIIRTGGIDTHLPDNALFRTSADNSAHFLVETDPRYADYRQWLSSDYLLQSLSLDPSVTEKRLGDGFYEQKLVREQVALLSGRRFLEGYTSDEQQYLALMNAGATFARQYDLRPGIALSAEQVAQLTSDIVWLVEKTVTLPDGKSAQVLAPQVYARVREGDLQATGALIAGRDMDLRLSGDLSNSGTLAGQQQLALQTENLDNLGGRIQADTLAIDARQDINNRNGSLTATRALQARAGRDLRVESTTSTQQASQGSTTNLERIAGLYVTGENGILQANAGRDLTLVAAAIQNGGVHGQTQLVAARDINLTTTQVAATHHIVWDGQNSRSDASQSDVGSQIHTNGDISLSAGNDINARAASITSQQGGILSQAGRDISLTAGELREQVDEAHQHQESGLLSSKTITTRDTLEQSSAQASTLSATSIALQAGNNILMQGSNAVSDQAATVNATGDVTLAAATQSRRETHYKKTDRSGMFSSGGVGVTVGTQQQSARQSVTSQEAAASTLGSTAGNVSVESGKTYTQLGSDVLAPQGDIAIRAQGVEIREARQTRLAEAETRFKQSGLTLALSNPVITAIQTAEQMKDAAHDTEDGRMKALAAATAALSAKNAYDRVAEGMAKQDASADVQAGGINLSISVGASQSESKSTQSSDTAAGSHLTAGRNIDITASGAGHASDLVIQGSDLSAGDAVHLHADDDIALLAAQNTTTQRSNNSNSAFSLGISVGTSGFGITASGSLGRGNADGDDLSYSNTHLQARDIQLDSGGDSTLKGAVVRAEHVGARVGGDLTIESLQDTSRYNSNQQSIGGSVTVGAASSGSLSFNQSKIRSEYVSVAEQSGIRAGDAGFDIAVNGHTALNGGAITSTQQAVEQGRNTFSTGSLSTRDIENRAEYHASSVGVSLGSGSNADGRLAPQGTSAGLGGDSDSAHSITRAAISGIAGNTAARTGDKESGLQPIFEADKVQREIDAQTHITQTFSALAPKQIADFADSKTRDYTNALKQKLAIDSELATETDPERRAELESYRASVETFLAGHQSEYDLWKEGGAYRIALHTATGALTGGGAGALGAASSATAAPLLNQWQQNVQESLIQAGASDTLAQGVALNLSSATAIGLGSLASGGSSAGAASALSVDANNRQLHVNEIDFLKDKQRIKRFADKYGLSESEAARELARSAAGAVDAHWDFVLGEAEGDTERARAFLAQEIIATDNLYLFQATDAEYANERLGLKALFSTPAGIGYMLERLALENPATYRRDPRYRQVILDAKGQGSSDAMGNLASDAWYSVRHPIDTLEAGIEGLIQLPGAISQWVADFKYKGAEDTLHIMQGDIAGVEYNNAKSSTTLGVSIGTAGLGGDAWGVSTLRHLPSGTTERQLRTVVRDQDGPITIDGTVGFDGSGKIDGEALAGWGANRTPLPGEIDFIGPARPADAVNARFVAEGYKPPYLYSVRPREFTTSADMDFVRVHGPTNQEGDWMVRASEIEGMSPVQIKEHLALKYEPTHISTVTVQQGARMRVGRVGPQIQWNVPNPQGVQYELLDSYKAIFQPPRKLP